ncbi:hypothetical protein A6R68_16816 [Neotoma lepida]|uniref:Uncharacterized protein n=1 Tax=Neotoma lepida TaxID=56216 RepID=A0A1A6HGF0_NEOLE|nr:hypothetical protein A6R68_16816 [Neotoma lepida]
MIKRKLLQFQEYWTIFQKTNLIFLRCLSRALHKIERHSPSHLMTVSNLAVSHAEDLLTLSNTDANHPKDADLQMKQPSESKPVNVSVTYREVSMETHPRASSGSYIFSYLSPAAATAMLLGVQH